MKKVKLELVGSDGNAFAILGRFQRAAREQGWTPAEIKGVTAEATSGDYHHLLATIMEHTDDDPMRAETCVLYSAMHRHDD